MANESGLEYGVLLPYQKRWVADESPVKVAEKSRRIGFTWAEACEDVLLAAASDGMDVWYIGYNQDLAQEFIHHCAAWTRHFNRIATAINEEVIADENKKILSYNITYESGYRISALSSRPSTLRGKGGKVVVDEAAFHPDLREVMKAAMAFLMWGGRVAIISTHNGNDNEYNELLKEIRSGRYPYSLHRVTFADAIDDGLYERIRMSLVNKGAVVPDKSKWIADMYAFYGESASEELDCIPAKSAGAYFTQALLDGVMRDALPVLRYSSPSLDFIDWSLSRRQAHTIAWCEQNLSGILADSNHSQRYFAGVDAAGRRGDLATMWILTETRTLNLETIAVIELERLPFSETERVIGYVLDKLPCVVAFDATGNGEQLAERARQQYGNARVYEQKINDGYYLEAMPAAKRWIEDRKVTIPRDSGVLSDFRQVTVLNGIPKILSKKNIIAGTQRHGDTVSAYILAIRARNKLGDYKQPEYESLGKCDNEISRLFSW